MNFDSSIKRAASGLPSHVVKRSKTHHIPHHAEEVDGPSGAAPMDVPPAQTHRPQEASPLRAHQCDQIVAQDEVPPRNAFEQLLCHDVGPKIIGYVISADLVYSHDDRPLEDATRLYSRLASASKTLGRRMRALPFSASIRWLWTLNHIRDPIRGDLDLSFLTELVHGNRDVRLPGRPHAQRARTDILLRRLLWCAPRLDQFLPSLDMLFEQASGQTLDSNPALFIDPQHLALSAFHAIVYRRLKPPHDNVLTQVVEHIAPKLDRLPTQHRAAFWAELAVIPHKLFELKARAKKMLDELITQDPKLSDFGKFVAQAAEFLDNPDWAPDEVKEAMIAHLARNDVPMTSMSIALLRALSARLWSQPVRQRAQLEIIAVRYLETFNAMHRHLDMTAARDEISRIPHALLASAFNKLEIDDKLKIVDLLDDADSPHGYSAFRNELEEWLPMIEIALRDDAIPRDRRIRLADDLLSRIKPSPIRSNEATQVKALRVSLLRQED